MVYIETSLKDKWKQNFEVITGIQVQYGMVYIETSLKEKWKQNLETKIQVQYCSLVWYILKQVFLPIQRWTWQ